MLNKPGSQVPVRRLRCREQAVGCSGWPFHRGRCCLFPGRPTGTSTPHVRGARGCVLACLGHRCGGPDRTRTLGAEARGGGGDSREHRGRSHRRQERLERLGLWPVQCRRGASGDVAGRALVRSCLSSRQPAPRAGLLRRGRGGGGDGRSRCLGCNEALRPFDSCISRRLGGLVRIRCAWHHNGCTASDRGRCGVARCAVVARTSRG